MTKGFCLEEVVPWGRSFEEYVSIFSLTGSDLEKRILGCGDGPAGFNAVLSERGGQVVSADPLYRFSADEIRRRIEETKEKIVDQLRINEKHFVWDYIGSVGALERVRLEAMGSFLDDFESGKKEGRYLVRRLPHLGFEEREFDLVLCSHLLFLYSGQLSLEFHLNSIDELCRVGREVRIFPLLELSGEKSRHIGEVTAYLDKSGRRFEIERVAYEFQKGGNEMLVIKEEGESV